MARPLARPSARPLARPRGARAAPVRSPYTAAECCALRRAGYINPRGRARTRARARGSWQDNGTRTRGCPLAYQSNVQVRGRLRHCESGSATILRRCGGPAGSSNGPWHGGRAALVGAHSTRLGELREGKSRVREVATRAAGSGNVTLPSSNSVRATPLHAAS